MDEHAEFGVMPPFHAALLVSGRRATGGIAPRRRLGAGRLLGGSDNRGRRGGTDQQAATIYRKVRHDIPSHGAVCRRVRLED
jgi:hypothetical protein